MSISGCCRPIRDTWDRPLHGCYQPVPCLSDPAARSSLCLKVTLLMLHLVCVGVIFLLDRGLIEKTRKEPWYTAIYLLLLIATLVQYFFTSGSSPGYVLDAMRTADDTHSIFNKTSTTSKQYASDKNRNLIITVEGNRMGRNYSGINASSWMKLVMSMYPPGSSVRGSTCTYCHIVQPPRSKHCHDCDKCVLQFDHHCVWLGTCIGQGNHCRFWWYIFGETALCIWTCILYITYLKANISRTWWKDVIVILLLAILSICLVFLLLLLLFHSYLVLTNQTTYELVRRRRISYLRGIPERVYPFSKGICRNLYNFCCAQSGTYVLEPLPTVQEIGAKSRPYTCVDVLSCRCC